MRPEESFTKVTVSPLLMVRVEGENPLSVYVTVLVDAFCEPVDVAVEVAGEVAVEVAVEVASNPASFLGGTESVLVALISKFKLLLATSGFQ